MLTREPRLNHPAQSCWPLHALHASVPTMAPLLSHRHRRLGPPRIPAIAVAILLLGFASHAVVGPVRAFSAPASSSSDGSITIVGLPGGQVQSLPGMYVKSIRRWIEVEEGGGGNGIIQLEPIPGAGGVGIRDDDDDGIPSGWVDPTSTSDLWWPRDLDSLQVRPALNVLFRSGVLSYVSAGLDVRVPTRRRNDGCRGGGDVREDDGDGIAAVVAAPPPSSSSWRNHGLNSQPIARQWTTPGIAYERMFHVEGFVLPLPRKGGEGGEGGGGDDDDDGRKKRHERTLFPSLNARGAMERAATFAAEMDDTSPLAGGFHIASFPMTREWIDLPRNSMNDEEGREDDGGGGGGGGGDDDGGTGTEPSSSGGVAYKIVCMATSEPFASKLLDLDEDILAMSSTSVLEIDVSRTAEGGKSMYLPEVYKDLYLNGVTHKMSI